MGKRILPRKMGICLVLTIAFSLGSVSVVQAGIRSDSSKLYCPKGRLIAHVWRGGGKNSGNTKKWDYQVSSKYKGRAKIKWIQTRWYSAASLRKSASISLGVSNSSASASSSSSWMTVKTKTKYWKNNNGSKSADWRSNTLVGPRKDYRSNTIYTSNTGTLKLKGYPKKYEISAGI